MTAFNPSIIAAALILVVNHYQFGANAFDHVAVHNDKTVQKSSNSEEENHTPIYPNGRQKRYDTVQNIGQYINDEREKYVTKRYIRGTRSTATESVLALTQGFKDNYKNRKGKSQFENHPPSREYLPTNLEYLPPSREFLPPNREYLPTNREYLPPSREYLPVPEAHVTETTSTSTAGSVETIGSTQKLEESTTDGIKINLYIDKYGNSTVESNKNDALTKPEIAPNLKDKIQTDLDFSGNINITNINSDTTGITKNMNSLTDGIKINLYIDKDGNSTVESNKNDALTKPEIVPNLKDKIRTDLDFTGNINSTNINSDTTGITQNINSLTDGIKINLYIDKDGNSTVESNKNDALTKPEIAPYLNDTIRTDLDFTGNINITNINSDTTGITKNMNSLTDGIKINLYIDKDGNSTVESNKNDALTKPEIAPNLKDKIRTDLDFSGNINITNINSDTSGNTSAMKPDEENNNCSNIKEPEDHHKEDHHKKYDHVVHHYHHIVYHHPHHNVPHIDHHYYDVPHIDYHHEHNYHNCGENNPTSTTMKPCSGNSEDKQQVRKHKLHNYPSFSYYPHYPIYPHLLAYPHYPPISISYVSDEDSIAQPK